MVVVVVVVVVVAVAETNGDRFTLILSQTYRNGGLPTLTRGYR